MWVDVDEPWAKPPRGADKVRTWSTDDLETNEFAYETFDGSMPDTIEAGAPLLLLSCNLASISLAEWEVGDITAIGCTFTNCDLSGVRFEEMASCEATSSKLMGTDFGESVMTDVRLSSCLLRYTAIRMAKLERVAFDDCQLSEADFFESELTDITFAGSSIEATDFQRVKAQRVDLRGASPMQLAPCNSLKGMLVDDHELPLLHYTLASIAGVSVASDD